MREPGDFDINTSKPFHVFLLAFVGFGLWLSNGTSFWLSLPLVGWVLARWIVQGFSALRQVAEADATEAWNGRYFSYDDVQVRIFWDDEQTWVRAADVYALMGLSPDAVSRRKIAARLGPADYRRLAGEAGECFSAPGVLRYLNGFADLRAAKFRRWLEREVFATLAKQRECATGAFERHKLS